jgi:hypothetical protein
MDQALSDTYVKVRLDRNVFMDLERFSQLRNVPKSTIASLAIKQLLEKDIRWQMKRFFYAPNTKSTKIPAVGEIVRVAFEKINIPHFAYSRKVSVANATDRSFQFMLDIVEGSEGPPYATVHGEGMDLSSGILIEPKAAEGCRGVFELPNEYVWPIK